MQEQAPLPLRPGQQRQQLCCSSRTLTCILVLVAIWMRCGVWVVQQGLGRCCQPNSLQQLQVVGVNRGAVSPHRPPPCLVVQLLGSQAEQGQHQLEDAVAAVGVEQECCCKGVCVLICVGVVIRKLPQDIG